MLTAYFIADLYFNVKYIPRSKRLAVAGAWNWNVKGEITGPAKLLAHHELPHRSRSQVLPT